MSMFDNITSEMTLKGINYIMTILFEQKQQLDRMEKLLKNLVEERRSSVNSSLFASNFGEAASREELKNCSRS